MTKSKGVGRGVGGGRPRLDPVANWWSKVDKRGPDECWPWKAGTDRDGYGKFAIGLGNREQLHVRATRFGYEFLVGPLGDDEFVCHTCDNPPCCNPAHWFAGTNQQNVEDKMVKGRFCRRKPGTHCVLRGHPLDGTNLYISPRGVRRCRACATLRARERYVPRKRGPYKRKVAA